MSVQSGSVWNIQVFSQSLTTPTIIFSQKKTFKNNYVLNKLFYKNTGWTKILEQNIQNFVQLLCSHFIIFSKFESDGIWIWPCVLFTKQTKKYFEHRT